DEGGVGGGAGLGAGCLGWSAGVAAAAGTARRVWPNLSLYFAQLAGGGTDCHAHSRDAPWQDRRDRRRRAGVAQTSRRVHQRAAGGCAGNLSRRESTDPLPVLPVLGLFLFFLGGDIFAPPGT